MPPVNRLVTRGMGASRGVPGRAGLVTQGMGGIFRFIVKEIPERIIRVGRSSAKRAAEGLEEIVVWAKLVSVNEQTPEKKVEGFIKLGIDRARRIAVTLTDGITARVKSAYNNLRVTISRIK